MSNPSRQLGLHPTALPCFLQSLMALGGLAKLSRKLRRPGGAFSERTVMSGEGSPGIVEKRDKTFFSSCSYNIHWSLSCTHPEAHSCSYFLPRLTCAVFWAAVSSMKGRGQRGLWRRMEMNESDNSLCCPRLFPPSPAPTFWLSAISSLSSVSSLCLPGASCPAADRGDCL
jgi:hypothetical protein